MGKCKDGDVQMGDRVRPSKKLMVGEADQGKLDKRDQGQIWVVPVICWGPPEMLAK